MYGMLIAAVVLSGVLAYLVGYAFRAPGGSFFRSMTGGLALAMFVLVILLLPPTLMSFAGDGGLLAWPSGLDRGLYRALWIAATAGGLLAGLRVWRMRDFFRRGITLDESPVSRAEAQLLLVDSLEEALSILGREKLTAKDLQHCAKHVRHVGNRFWNQVPERKADAYKLVAEHVPAVLAASVTGLLLEGAARK
ncbi:MAG: hypothetical protein JXE06_02190 [Coriobacteriia bacterium]|nr:hypothetical protein [Coriobacteriia bacterium]MBN2821647.1 hypothetical protein [Coriobacteriia bacterium]